MLTLVTKAPHTSILRHTELLKMQNYSDARYKFSRVHIPLLHYSFVLNCGRGLYCIFEIFLPPWHFMMMPHFTRMWVSSLSATFSLSFLSHFYQSLLCQALQPSLGGALSISPSNFSPNTIWWDHYLFFLLPLELLGFAW